MPGGSAIGRWSVSARSNNKKINQLYSILFYFILFCSLLLYSILFYSILFSLVFFAGGWGHLYISASPHWNCTTCNVVTGTAGGRQGGSHGGGIEIRQFSHGV
jgi:hypothetical protein